MQPFNLEQALAGKPFTNDKGWTVEDWHYFKNQKYPVHVKWRQDRYVLTLTESELFMLPEKKKVWIVVYKYSDGTIMSCVMNTKENADEFASSRMHTHLETSEKEYEL